MYLINSAWERARETVEGKWNSKEEKNIFTGENVDIYIKKKKLSNMKPYSWLVFPSLAVQTTQLPQNNFHSTALVNWMDNFIVQQLAELKAGSGRDNVISCFTIMPDHRKPNCFCWRRTQQVEERMITQMLHFSMNMQSNKERHPLPNLFNMISGILARLIGVSYLLKEHNPVQLHKMYHASPPTCFWNQTEAQFQSGLCTLPTHFLSVCLFVWKVLFQTN